MKDIKSNDPIDHIQNIKSEMEELIDHLRRDIRKIDEPQAKALFETSAEVITGLKKAFDHYKDKNEVAWDKKTTEDR